MAEINLGKIQSVPRHTHNGTDSVQINYDDVLNLEDLLWNKFFYSHTFFESVDGYTKTGTATIDGTGVTLNTGSTNSALVKEPLVQAAVGSLDFSKESRIRFGIEFGASSLSAVTARFTFGTFGIGENYYGFEITNAALSGSSSNGDTSSSNAISLATLVGGTSYELEARLFPKSGIHFYVDGAKKGILRSELPSGTSANLMEAGITTTNASVKTVVISYHELLQKR